MRAPGRARWEGVLLAGFFAALAAILIWLLRESWMRWMDVQVDFGREVYLPWRILAGEHLGRDFIHPYGPLSVYCNAGLFALFGTSIRTLIVANLCIFIGVLCALWFVSQRAFGRLGAAVAVTLGALVFGLGHFVGINNYTYLAPYSHEATHGMLLLLLLLGVLSNIDHESARLGAGARAGVLSGLCALTKTEYVLAAGAVVVAVLARLWFDRNIRPSLARWMAGVLLGSVGVFGLAVVLLSCATDLTTALETASNGVLAPLRLQAYSQSDHVRHFLGIDNFAANMGVVWKTGAATVAVVGAAGLMFSRLEAWGSLPAWIAAALILAGGISVGLTMPWQNSGLALPAMLAMGAWVTIRDLRQSKAVSPVELRRVWTRALFLLAGLAMLARMIFAPKIFHYGFFQAMLGGTWVCAYLAGHWPTQIARSTRLARAVQISVVATLMLATLRLVDFSLVYYRSKQLPVGAGTDRIVGYNPDFNQIVTIMEQARQYLESHPKPEKSLLVVPEGILLNYLSRHRHPLRLMDVLPATLRLESRDVLQQLNQNPPAWVIYLPRLNSVELGFRSYGEDLESGKALVDWVNSRYHPVAGAGGEPFLPNSVGVRILLRNDLMEH